MAFFGKVRPGQRATHGHASFELPILYHREDYFALLFTASLSVAAKLMPSERLFPVRMARGRALVGIAAFHYTDTSIGEYGEVAVTIPAVYGRLPPLPVLPALLEGRHRRFGLVVLHLPVTTLAARDAGRGAWGYPKFVADMDFAKTPEFLQCRLAEKDRHIATLRVPKRGKVRADRRPLVTYSVRDGNLIRTRIPQRGIRRDSRFPRGWQLELGDHPVADTLRELDLSARPVLARYWLERSAILPAGKVIQRGVALLDGHRGEDREGRLSVERLVG